jgi:4-amino-4-deoxy-L-arabinose transferase-like glycosyltransferase
MPPPSTSFPFPGSALSNSTPHQAASAPARTLRISLLTLAATLFLVILWFGTLDYRRLADPDEGRYAEIAREMVASGDWITPRLNGLKYFEKPALQYWATAAAFRAFGATEGVARLWPALTGLLAIVAMTLAALRLWGRDAAIASGLVLAGCVWFMGGGHVLTLDMGVTGFMSLTLASFLIAQRDTASPAARRYGMWLAWAAMGLAVLSKGLIGVVLPGAILTLYIVWQRDWQRLKQLQIGAGLVIFLAITLPWFITVSLRNPEFAQFFFIHEHFQRYTTDISHRVQPWWYFLPLLLAGTLPWISLLPGALRLALTRVAGDFQPQRLLLLWAGFICVFFSVSDSKLPLYILPVFPALAPLLARYALKLPRAVLARHLLFAAAIGALIGLIGGALALGWQSQNKGVPAAMRDYGDWIAVGGAVMALTLFMAAASIQRGRTLLAFYAAALSTLIGGQIIGLGHDTMAASNSSYALAQLIAAKTQPGTELYEFRHYDQSLPFYLKRTIPLVDYQDEFALGQQMEPTRNSVATSTLIAHWRAGRRILVVTREGGQQTLARAGLRTVVLYRDRKRMLLANPAVQP